MTRWYEKKKIDVIIKRVKKTFLRLGVMINYDTIIYDKRFIIT